MGLGATFGKAVFGHRTHVARPCGTPGSFKRPEGHIVANASGAISAASDWPTGGREGAHEAYWTQGHTLGWWASALFFQPRRGARAAKGVSVLVHPLFISDETHYGVEMELKFAS